MRLTDVDFITKEGDEGASVPNSSWTSPRTNFQLLQTPYDLSETKVIVGYPSEHHSYDASLLVGYYRYPWLLPCFGMYA